MAIKKPPYRPPRSLLTKEMDSEEKKMGLYIPDEEEEKKRVFAPFLKYGELIKSNGKDVLEFMKDRKYVEDQFLDVYNRDIENAEGMSIVIHAHQYIKLTSIVDSKLMAIRGNFTKLYNETQKIVNDEYVHKSLHNKITTDLQDQMAKKGTWETVIIEDYLARIIPRIQNAINKKTSLPQRVLTGYTKKIKEDTIINDRIKQPFLDALKRAAMMRGWKINPDAAIFRYAYAPQNLDKIKSNESSEIPETEISSLHKEQKKQPSEQEDADNGQEAQDE